MMRKLACGLCPLAFAIVLPLAALAQGMPAAEPESLGLSTKRLERIAPALRRDIAAGLIPGAVMLVARRGKLAYFEAFGMRDKARNVPMPRDAIFRLASMTKPITIAAAMMLVEEGRLSLADPISKYLPQFAHMQVGIEVNDSAAAMVEKLARLPLMYQPGTVWEYGRSIDVLGRILELLSGMPLSEFLAKRVFGPLRMPDTGFWVPPKKYNRIADVLPAPREGRRLLLNVSKPPKFESGGGGLVSTAADYARFLQMLLNGGEIDGVRLLSRKSVELITTNQLGPEVNAQGWAYYPGPGYGFGLGFAVRLALGVAPQIGSPGDYFVEGLYGTFAFADPREQLLAVFMIQSQEWRYYRPLVKALVLQSLTH